MWGLSQVKMRAPVKRNLSSENQTNSPVVPAAIGKRRRSSSKATQDSDKKQRVERRHSKGRESSEENIVFNAGTTLCQMCGESYQQSIYRRHAKAPHDILCEVENCDKRFVIYLPTYNIPIT